MATSFQKENPGLVRLIEVLKRMDEILSDQEVREKYICRMTSFFKNDFRDGSERIKHDELCALFNELGPLTDEELVNEDIRAPDPFSLSILRGAGYKVIPGEKDDFGWLTGVIVAKNFRYMFG